MPQSDFIAIIVALISLIATITVIIINSITKSRQDEKIKNLEHHLGVERDELSAKREYEFVARKRLYAEFEPLLFQLLDH